nr:SlyX family protein [Streptomyces lavendulae]
MPGSDSGVWGAIIALIGLAGAIYTGRNGGPKQIATPQGEEGVRAAVELVERSGGQLQVSPAIWSDMNSKITALETKVDHLTDLVEQGQGRENRLRELLRSAMKVIRRANARLDAAGLPEEPVPVEITPYG